jgi:hypothetical protein
MLGAAMGWMAALVPYPTRRHPEWMIRKPGVMHDRRLGTFSGEEIAVQADLGVVAWRRVAMTVYLISWN